MTSGPPKVYLVFWGSQWGTQGSNSAGNVTLSGDPKGMAPYVESFIKGIGTNSETWSGVMTQYCEGVATRRHELSRHGCARRLPDRRRVCRRLGR